MGRVQVPRRLLAVLVGLLLIQGAFGAVPAAQASGWSGSQYLHGYKYRGKTWTPTWNGPKPSSDTPVPGTPVGPASPAVMASRRAAVARKYLAKGATFPVKYVPPKVSWPNGTGTAPLTVTASGSNAASTAQNGVSAGRLAIATGWRAAGALPVSVSAVTAHGADAGMTAAAAQGSGSGVQVTVSGRAAAAALGIRGLVLSAAGTGALASAGGQVGIRVDYSGFAAAYGGGYGGRLRLAVLPAR